MALSVRVGFPARPCKSARFADEGVSEGLYFFKDPQGRTLLTGSAHTLPSAHLQLTVEVVGHDRTDHVALIGRSAAAGNIAECSLAFEFCEYVLLLSATFQEANRLSDGAAFVGNHAFIVVLRS